MANTAAPVMSTGGVYEDGVVRAFALAAVYGVLWACWWGW